MSLSTAWYFLAFSSFLPLAAASAGEGQEAFLKREALKLSRLAASALHPEFPGGLLDTTDSSTSLEESPETKPPLPQITMGLDLSDVDLNTDISKFDKTDPHDVEPNLGGIFPAEYKKSAFVYPTGGGSDDPLRDGGFVFYDKSGTKVVGLKKIMSGHQLRFLKVFEGQELQQGQGCTDSKKAAGLHKISWVYDTEEFCWLPECNLVQDTTMGCFVYKMANNKGWKAFLMQQAFILQDPNKADEKMSIGIENVGVLAVGEGLSAKPEDIKLPKDTVVLAAISPKHAKSKTPTSVNGGALKPVYDWLGISKADGTYPQDVSFMMGDEAKGLGRAKFQEYPGDKGSTKKVIHVVSPDLGEANFKTDDQAKEALVNAYQNVFKEFLEAAKKHESSVPLRSLRLLPISGGTMGGEFLKDMPRFAEITKNAMVISFGKLTQDEKKRLEKKDIILSIFKKDEFEVFVNAFSGVKQVLGNPEIQNPTAPTEMVAVGVVNMGVLGKGEKDDPAGPANVPTDTVLVVSTSPDVAKKAPKDVLAGGGAVQGVYEWVGGELKSDKYPEDVAKVMGAAEPKKAVYHAYGDKKVIHVICPAFQDDDRFKNLDEAQAAEALGETYLNVFHAFLGSKQKALRLLPISSGMQAGHLKDKFPEMTKVALQNAFQKLSDDERKQLERTRISLNIFKEDEFQSYADVMKDLHVKKLDSAAPNAAPGSAETAPGKPAPAAPKPAPGASSAEGGPLKVNVTAHIDVNIG